MANKTVPTDLGVEDYLASIADPQRQADCRKLDALLRDVTGWEPRIWGQTLKSGIVGYGTYHYIYDSGREGDAMRVGFANRAQNISIYIMPGYQDFEDEMSRLGRHKRGKACLYIKRLSDVDLAVLREIVEKGLRLLEAKYPL